MNILQALVLGVVQGITEFLPISSSGHLILVPKFLHWPDQGLAFDVMLHVGTLGAILIFFRKRIFKVIKSFFVTKGDYKENRKLGYLILAAIVPAGIIGFLFNDFIEGEFRAAWIVGVSLIFWAIIMFIAERVSKKFKKIDNLSKLGFLRSILIGFFQVIALVPGTSRSGITITAGLFSKLKREKAAEFSFLIGAPLMAGAGILKLMELLKNGTGDIGLMALLVGLFASFISGYFAIKFLIGFLKVRSLNIFIVYRIILGIIILLTVY